jgi:hypothetical protein
LVGWFFLGIGVSVARIDTIAMPVRNAWIVPASGLDVQGA